MTLTIEQQIVPLKADADGVMRVGTTRVTLERVVHAFEQGHTAEEIVSHYPALRLADVYAVIAYYLDHQADVHTYLQHHEAASRKIWAQIEANADYHSFRKRLLARHQATSNPEQK